MKRESNSPRCSVTAASCGRAWRMGQDGITLLFTLGFLSVMLIMMLTLAMLSRTERRSAALSAQSVRSRLTAETAMERALADLRVGATGKLVPADSFLAPDEDSAWSGRRLLVSRETDDDSGDLKAGLADAVSATIAGMDVMPAKTPDSKATWIPVISKIRDGENTVDAIIARYTYIIQDATGLIDPAAVVHRDQSEQSDLAVKFGYSLTDISLGDIGFSDPDRFNYQDATYPGKMPDVGRWFSLRHMIQGLDLTQSEVDLAMETLHPFSRDTEFFWRDRNGNGVWDEGEDSPRLNIVQETDPSVLYHQFVGAVQSFSYSENGVDAGDDDCDWLKELDGNAWFQAWKNRVFASYSEPERTYRARASVAAQVAANITDYADPDSRPTSVYLGSEGDIHVGSASSTLTFHGIENNWGISEVAMRVQGDVILSEEESTTTTTETASDTAEDIDFTVVSGKVIPHEAFEASVTVLGVQLGMYDMSYTPARLMYWCGVTADVVAGSDVLSPWGDYTNCYDNNLNDDNNPRNYDIPDSYPAGTAVSVRSKYYYHPYTYDYKTHSYSVSSTWSCFETLTSTSNTDRVKVLKDGDSVPEITTVIDQNNVAYYLEDYVENGKISLQPNQVIFLFETNTTTSSAGQDFQDLVVLVTLRKSDEEGDPDRTSTFTMDGEVNINPNNSADQFYITKPDGSQITRDDLHKYGRDYTGPATWIHVRPKGNANENSITLNGVNYPLKNGVTYDFSGSFQIHLYNDKYVNGKAMGHWWIGLEGTEISVVEEGQAYVIETETTEETTSTVDETATTTTTVTEDEYGMQIGSSGSDLRVRAGFQVELFYPFGEGEELEFAPEGVTVQYTLQVTTATGKSLNHTGTVDMLPSHADNADGGSLLWTSDYTNGEWLIIEDAFDKDQEPALATYTVTMARIDSVVVRDRLDDVVDRVPSSNGPLCAWASDGAIAVDQQFYSGIACYDPLMNDRGQDWADFEMFWDVRPSDRTLATASSEEIIGIGSIDGGYNSAPYSGIQAKNSPIERLGELGRVHSYQPKRSLRLWAASRSDESGHDASILDVFKVGNAVQTRGKININSLHPAVLEALFDGCTTVSASSAAQAILDYRADGSTFGNMGQAFGAVAGVTGSNPVLDEVEENAVAALAEKVTVRQNYFRVLVCAQAVKDVRNVPYRSRDGSLTTAKLGQFDAAYDSDGNFIRYVDQVMAEEKLMAVVYRDAFSGKVRVEHIEMLNE